MNFIADSIVKGRPYPALARYQARPYTPSWREFGQHKNAMGWDPLGTKQIKQAFDAENQKTAFLPDPRFSKSSRQAVRAESVLKNMPIPNKKTKNIITESLKLNNIDPDAGTLLDENNIL